MSPSATSRACSGNRTKRIGPLALLTRNTGNIATLKMPTAVGPATLPRTIGMSDPWAAARLVEALE